MVENTHNVPNASWNRWTETGRRVFNTAFEQAEHQNIIKHHDDTIRDPVFWDAIRWNIAWNAAHEISKQEKASNHG